MARRQTGSARLPRGVVELPQPRQGRRFKARIRQGKRGEVHLGLYATPWLAAFAYNVAAQALGRSSEPPNAMPHGEQPSPDEVRRINAFVLGRLGLDPGPASRPVRLAPPSFEALQVLFEIALAGFWRSQVAAGDSGAEDPIEAPARRLLDSAAMLFWAPTGPTPLQVLTEAVSTRFDAAFRSVELTREVLDDACDDPLVLARWLVHPDTLTGRVRSFRDEVRRLYTHQFDREPAGSHASADGSPWWADILGLTPPYTAASVRLAFRTRSRTAHPDTGGTEAAFVRLQAAYEAARRAVDRLDDAAASD